MNSDTGKRNGSSPKGEPDSSNGNIRDRVIKLESEMKHAASTLALEKVITSIEKSKGELGKEISDTKSELQKEISGLSGDAKALLLLLRVVGVVIAAGMIKYLFFAG